MKKQKNLIAVVVGLLCCSGMAAAETYTWTPVNGSTDWSSSANWILGSTNEAMTSNSPLANEQWGTVIIDGNYTISYSGATEGWASSIQVKNGANVTLSSFTKFQKTELVVGLGSTLNISNSTGVKFNANESGYSWTIDGTVNIGSALSWHNPNQAYTVNLGTTGILNLTNNSLGTFDFTASLGSLGSGSSYTVVTRDLVTGVTSYNGATYTIDGGTAVTDFDTLTLTAENLGKYQVYEQDGKVTLKYIVAVPEPATATLSLLALASLAARRRR